MHAVRRAKERANATPEQLIHMAKEAAFFAQTPNKKYVKYQDYMIVLGKEGENVYTIITLMLAEWFHDGLVMQERIDRHL